MTSVLWHFVRFGNFETLIYRPTYPYPRPSLPWDHIPIERDPLRPHRSQRGCSERGIAPVTNRVCDSVLRPRGRGQHRCKRRRATSRSQVGSAQRAAIESADRRTIDSRSDRAIGSTIEDRDSDQPTSARSTRDGVSRPARAIESGDRIGRSAQRSTIGSGSAIRSAIGSATRSAIRSAIRRSSRRVSAGAKIPHWKQPNGSVAPE
jgi:hypothetical protein